MAAFTYKGYRAQYKYGVDWSADIFPPGIIVSAHTVQSPGSKGHSGILVQIKEWIDAREARDSKA